MAARHKAFLVLFFCVGLAVCSSGWASTQPIGFDERAFFAAVERPQIKPRQKLGRWFVSAESLLWRSALAVLSDKVATKLASGDDCEMAMWVAARNEASRQSLNQVIVPFATEVMTSGLSPALSAFTTPGKILVAETLTLSIRLFNRSTFGMFETRDLPPEVLRTILNITIGYMAPHLTDDYFSQKLIEKTAPPAFHAVMSSLIEKEETVVSRTETTNANSRNFGPRNGLPLVNVNVILVYSPFTHFITLFVRGVGHGCLGNQLFILQYEVDKDGLLIKDSPINDRQVINLETRSPVVNVTNAGTLVQEKYRINSELGNLPRELCTQTETVPGYKYPLCYMRHWRPWIFDLLKKTAGQDYMALLADTQTQAPAQFILVFPSQRKYVVFSGCRPHLCPHSYAYVLVDPVKREIEIIWIREDAGVRFIGPNAEILKRTYAFGWLQYQGNSLWGSER